MNDSKWLDFTRINTDQNGDRWVNEKDALRKIAALEAREAKLVADLEDVVEHTSSHLEDMQHYFENKCIPTVDEVNQCAVADSKLRLALAQFEADKGGKG